MSTQFNSTQSKSVQARLRIPILPRSAAMLGSVCLSLLVLCLPAYALEAGTAPVAELGPCEQALSEPGGQTYESALCFYQAAAASGAWQYTSERLVDLATRYPSNHWLSLVRGYTLSSLGDVSAQGVFRDSAVRFRETGNLRGELLALANLRIQLFEQGDMPGALDAMLRIKTIGDLTQDAELKVRALVVEGRHWIDSKLNLDDAFSALSEAQRRVTEAHGYFVQREILNELGQLSVTFGRYEDALDYFNAFLELAGRQQDRAGEALALVNLASTHHEIALVEPTSQSVPKVLELAQLAEQHAQAVSILPLQLAAMRILAEAHAMQNPLTSQDIATRCIEQALQASLLWPQAQCLWVRSYATVQSEPERAVTDIQKALALMQEVSSSEPTQLAFAWRYYLRITWLADAGEDAFENSEKAMAAFESLRLAQSTQTSRSSVFSSWVTSYRWLAGRLLVSEPDVAVPIEAIARSLQVMERMRARNLLDALKVNRPSDAHDQNQQQLLNTRIARLNRQLLQGADSQTEQAILAELEAVERMEAGTRKLLQYSASTRLNLRELQGELHRNEALLSFQVGHWQSPYEAVPSGAWLVVVTQDEVKAWPLPDKNQLQMMAKLAAGAVGQPELFAQISRVGYDRLLSEALGQLPSQVDRLVIVPDSPLHAYPFAGLENTAGETLSSRYELSIAPSAGTWLFWRQQDAGQEMSQALVFANPDLSHVLRGHTSVQIWRDSVALDLVDLPAAANDTRVIESSLPGSQLLRGSDSSEAFIKQADFTAYNILHFGAHALLDQRFSERSALVLAPGSDDQDGLLQVREVGQLPLSGQLVVLASCQSALGANVEGEGIMSLARAFLAAGSQSVIGSLWPIQDEHASMFFNLFYQALVNGDSVGKSLSRAQRTMARGGYPPEAWAGYVVMGDDSWHMLRVAQSSDSKRWFLPALGVLLLCLIFFVYIRFIRNTAK